MSNGAMTWGVTRYEAVDKSGVAIFDVTVGCRTLSFTSVDRSKRTTDYADISVEDAAARIMVLEKLVAQKTWTKTTQAG